MLCPTRTHFVRVLLTTVFLLPVAQGKGADPDPGGESKPALLDVLLPADALLQVDGHKMRSTGEARHFETPPLAAGKTCVYSLKATWRSHTVTKTVRLRPGQLKTVDFGQELRTMVSAREAGSITLLAPPAMTVKAEREAKLALRVKRFNCPGSIRITFENVPKGIRIPDVTLEEGQSEKSVMIAATADVAPGPHAITVRASSGPRKDFSTIELTVVGPEREGPSKPEREPPQPLPGPEAGPEKIVDTKPEKKPQGKPDMKPETRPDGKPPATVENKPAPAGKAGPMSVFLSPGEITLRPGQTRFVEVKLVMDKEEALPAEPEITLAAAQGGLSWEKWSASDFTKNPTAVTAGFAIKASSDARPGKQSVRVFASVRDMKAERSLTVTIQPQETVKSQEGSADTKAGAAPSLRLELQTGIELQKGRTTYVEVRVKTTDGSPLPEVPSVTLESPPKAHLGATPWTTSFRPGQPSCTVGIAVTAETSAPTGKREVRVRAAAGGSTVEAALKVTVIAGPPSPQAAP
jgi:uncharacterized protein (TIGR03000 family)